ncbi:cytoplasmic dynein 2 heavy chain 1-like [Plutella xylostella]|uniref:cytoplasmic dynein 2 heavy chain 1-like n=1 Tax=Plutella xylostella TaxID=51655 RepID=UPI002032E3B6|nr:cytoplasmic dynein 2 heavy chain 1-like [Plutella xylostella]
MVDGVILDVWSWVVCDGDIDPEWVEALNSVLDDNHLLTLPSGWRIQFGPNVNFIFETHSLEHASPATVSRMGIILLSEENSCAQEMLNSWMEKVEIDNEIAKMALPLLQKVIKKCMQWFSTHRSDVIMKVYNVSMVRQIITQFEYIAANVGVSVMNTSPEELVYMAVQRGAMSVLKDSAVASFQDKMSELLGLPPVSTQPVAEWRDDVYLSSRLHRSEPAVRAVIGSPESHLLIIGPAASAKNLLAEYVLKDTNTSLVITIDCTPILEPEDIIKELKRHNLVRSGGTGSSRVGAILFVRSLHRARVDAWGSSAVHAMLLQIMQHGGFSAINSAADGGGVTYCRLQRTTLVMTSHGPALCPRLLAAPRTLAIPEPDDDELSELASNYLKQSVDRNISEKDMANVTKQILAMFKEITETFYSQPHYSWAASDLKRWCENVKWYSPSKTEELLLAVAAEANNIFRDRLVTDTEKERYHSILKRYFKDASSDDSYFIPKLRGTGVYVEAAEKKDWYQTTQKIINQCLTEQEHSVFGECGAEVCAELSILCPAMARATNGDLVVCVGSAGVGRRAAAYIVATSLPATLLFVNHSGEFNTQFKNALTSAGSEANRTLIVISESTINNTTLGLIEALMNAQTEYAVPRDILPSLSHSQPNQQFLENIKQNLGIIITLDKNQGNLLDILQKNPFLYQESHILWLDSWSPDTLRKMPQLIIQRLLKEDIAEVKPDDHESIPVEGFIHIYNSLEADWMKAPARYVSFIKAYYYIVKRKKAALVQRKNMLLSGVEALRRARSEVATLQSEAAEQEAALSDKQAKANQALDQIGATVRAATDRKEEMHALKLNIEQENEKLQIRKKEIEAELASVEPIVTAARAAVGEIKPESLSEVRSLRAPPEVVRDVLEGVLRLMGIADTSWHSMKNFLSKRGVKEDIRCLDASQITPEAVQSVQRLLETRGSSFEAAAARRASAACAPLAAWVRANVEHARALARVQPLQLQQAQLMRNLQDAENQLAALSTGLTTVDERVASLKEQLGKHTRDAATIELRLSNAAKTIDTARGLLEQLAQEYSAWETDLEHISKEILELNVRSLLAAAYIVYLPDVTEPQARDYIQKWGELIGFEDADFSVINFLSTTEKQLKWDADGLSSDRSAMKNAVLIDQILESNKCGFCPLIIDPDGDALPWLKNTLADMSCDFISQHSDKLQTAIQYAVRLGRVLVITDVDSIHPSWATLLRGLPLSGTTVANPSVRLLLYTRDATLPSRLPPQHRATLSLVHFTARVDGLTDQLVHYALHQQNPEVTEKAKEIKLQKATLQKQQHELQENLLKDLSTNSDILHDAHLIASLNKTRSSGATVAAALSAARAVEQQAASACRQYQPSADRTAILALAVKELTKHRPLVSMPVDAVLEIFVDAVKKGGDNDAIVKYVTRRIIERVLLGLYKRDKYIVVLHLLRQVYEEVIPENLWKIFVGDTDYVEDQKGMTEIKNRYSWMSDGTVKKVAVLQGECLALYNKLSLDNSELWMSFLKSGDLSIISKLKLNPFENIIAVATIRPESLYRAIVAFVDQVLGVGVMSMGGSLTLGGRGPRLLLGGATDQLAHAARAAARSFTQVMVDDGIEKWEGAVEAARSGGWVALVVGASPFPPQLITFLANLRQRPAEDFSPDFRLWIVSEDREIPPLISNSCINIVVEAPEGMKNNVMNTLSAWGDYSSQDIKLVRMHVCLALFHALVQERRAYIPEGWSRWYPFEWGDIAASTSIIRACGATATARGLLQALYRGRAGAAPDRELLAALARSALGEHTEAHAWRPRGLDKPLPYSTNIQAYAAALSVMPDIDSAAALGLPANCRVVWETKAAERIVAGLKELRASVNVNKKSESVNPLRPLLALWKKLMSGNPLVKGGYHNDKLTSSSSSWWGCVCACELHSAARLVRTVHAALAHLASDKNAALYKVPEEWQLIWEGPDDPVQYVKELSFRAHAAVKRMDAFTEQGDFPSELDIRSFLHPERVLAAARARCAQMSRCPPEALGLSLAWDCRSKGKTLLDGITLVGLLLTGARWDRRLVPAAGQDPPTAPAPPLTATYVQQQASPCDAAWSVRLYSSEGRERLLATAAAPALDEDIPSRAVTLYPAPIV